MENKQLVDWSAKTPRERFEYIKGDAKPRGLPLLQQGFDNTGLNTFLEKYVTAQENKQFVDWSTKTPQERFEYIKGDAKPRGLPLL